MKLIYEIFNDFKNAKTKQERINILRNNYNPVLRDILLGVFRKEIEFVFSEPINYIPLPMNTPMGFGYSSINKELSRLYIFIKNHPRVNPTLRLEKKRQLLRQILEILDPRESEIYQNLILKDLKIKGLTYELVKEALPGLL